MESNVKNVIRELASKSVKIMDHKERRPYVIYSLDTLNKNKVLVKYLDDKSEKEVYRSTVLSNFYRQNESRDSTSTINKELRRLFKDDSRSFDSDERVYKKWIKLKEKLRIYNNIRDFLDNPTDYIDENWLRYSTFNAWLTSQEHWEHLQIRGGVVLGKKIYDPDTCVYTKSAPIEKEDTVLVKNETAISYIQGSNKIYSLLHPEEFPEVPQSEISENEYVVYLAYHKGLLIYIGSGLKSRCQHVNSGSSHNTLLNELKFRVGDIPTKIIYKASSKIDATKKEAELIEMCKPICNKQFGAKHQIDSLASQLIKLL